MVDDQDKFKCYLMDLRYNIYSQIDSDLTTWFELNYPTGDRPLLYNTKVAIELNPSGEISKLDILESSGDASFDNALLQAIKNASPFELPREESIRIRLRKFTWEIHF